MSKGQRSRSQGPAT